jgi:hypothetical protein
MRSTFRLLAVISAVPAAAFGGLWWAMSRKGPPGWAVVVVWAASLLLAGLVTLAGRASEQRRLSRGFTRRTAKVTRRDVFKRIRRSVTARYFSAALARVVADAAPVSPFATLAAHLTMTKPLRTRASVVTQRLTGRPQADRASAPVERVSTRTAVVRLVRVRAAGVT